MSKKRPDITVLGARPLSGKKLGSSLFSVASELSKPENRKLAVDGAKFAYKHQKEITTAANTAIQLSSEMQKLQDDYDKSVNNNEAYSKPVPAPRNNIPLRLPPPPKPVAKPTIIRPVVSKKPASSDPVFTETSDYSTNSSVSTIRNDQRPPPPTIRPKPSFTPNQSLNQVQETDLPTERNIAKLVGNFKLFVDLNDFNPATVSTSKPARPPPPKLGLKTDNEVATTDVLLASGFDSPSGSYKLPSEENFSYTSDKKGSLYVALYDFTGQAGELSFAAGEEITVLQQVTDDWLFGHISNRTGQFPANFVTPYTNDEVELEQLVEESQVIKTSGLDFDVGDQLVSIAAFQSQLPDDLNFPLGAYITVVSIINDEWLMGEYNGKQGLVPKTFVQKPLTPDYNFENAGVVTNTKDSNALQAGDKAIAIYDYETNIPEDLSLKIGDFIQIDSILNEDWAIGSLGYQSGQFPLTYVKKRF